MSDETTRNGPPDPTPLFRLVRSTRKILRTSWVATGLGLTIGLLLGTLVIVAGFDLLLPPAPRVTLFNLLGLHISVPGSAIRFLGLLVVLVPTIYALVMGVIRPLLRRLALTTMARRIETYIPGVHNRLVSTIDLAQGHGVASTSPAFYRRLVDETLERIRGFKPSRVVDFLSLRRAGLFALGSTLAIVLAFALFSDRLPTAMARIFRPFADIPPVTGVQYAVTPGTTKVLRGEDVPFLVNVTKGEPKSLYLEVYPDGDAQPLRYDLQKRDASEWKFTLAGQLPEQIKKRFRYRVFGGGTWSKEHEIALVERPKIASYHTVLHYPEYMGIPEPREGPALKLDVAGPEESRLEVVVQTENSDADSPEESAAATGEIQILEAKRVRVPVLNRSERVWLDDQLPPGARDNGWQWDRGKHQRVTHTDSPSPLEHRHFFQDTPTGFQVQPGEHLFAWVYLVPENKPETIMVQWHDGQGWEHRAFWGADKIREGKLGTPSRHRVGDLPEAGQWVRLEVSAKDVGLDGHALRGMSFTLFGGQAYWHRAGAIAASHLEQDELQRVAGYPMNQVGPNQWSGSFTLRGQGLYRVELKNALGFANQKMKEGKFIASKDNPPEVALERPGTDLVLSTPGKVPVVVLASDDFGLKEIALRVQQGDTGNFDRTILKTYATPARNDSVVGSLDLVARQVKVGEFVRYRVEAVDRKGQVAKTQDFTVRIAADPMAADKQLAELEKANDPFHEKLVKLIAEQAKVRDETKKMDAKYAPVNEKIQKALAEQKAAQEKAQAEQKDPKVTVPPPALKLDAETEKQLAEMRKELAKLAEQERKNATAAAELSKELEKMSEQAAGTKMLPREIANELKRLDHQFKQSAVQPLNKLADEMTKGSDAKQAPPDTADMKQQADRIQRNLEAMKDVQKAVAEAQKNLRENADEALAELKREMQRMKAELTARELEDLKKFIEDLQNELRKMEARQQAAADDTKKSSDVGDQEKKQADLQKAIDDLLGKTEKLQSSDKMRRAKKEDPKFPKAPGDPDAGEEKVRPKEDAGDVPEKKDGKTDKNTEKGEAKLSPKEKGKEKADDEDEDKKFMPALGGPKPKVDPRFAKKQRPKKKDGSKEDRKADLEDRQEENMENLDQADKSLDSDKSTLDRLKDALESAAKQNKNGKGGKEGKPQDQDQNLADLMKSQAVQNALQMARRAQQMANAKGKPQQGKPDAASQANLTGNPTPGSQDEADLSKIDLPTRMMLMKLQPKLREELLQGMREEGPEGYQKFVQDYFKRLTEEKKP